MFLISRIKGYLAEVRWNFMCREPKQKVVEFDSALYVDNRELKYVLTDSVKTEPLGDLTIITLSFAASDYLKIK